MKVIIVGAGFTGTQLAKRLIAERYDVVLIDRDEETVRHASNRLDCMVVQANGNSLQILEDAGIAKADALIALTESDELNMITCSLVDSVYPDVVKIARVRNYDYYADAKKNAEDASVSSAEKNRRPLYGIDFMIHPDIEAADAIVSAVEHGAVTDITDFENSPYEMSVITIEYGSKLAGVAIQNIRQMTKCKFLVSFIERDTVATLPTGSTILEVGDRLGILTAKENLNEFLTLCGSELVDLKKIILVGAGNIGNHIAEKLIEHNNQSVFSKLLGIRKKQNQQFVIVDSDPKKANAASERFPDATVYRADITDDGFVEEENLQSFDLVITATHNHELNLVTAAYLKSLGIDRTICLVQNESFANIARKLQIDVVIPMKNTVVDTIMSHLRGKGVTGVHSVSDGDLEIVEVTIPEESKLIGKTFREVALPGQFLAMLIKKESAELFGIPDGNTLIEKNDRLVLITVCADTRKILSYFGVEA